MWQYLVRQEPVQKYFVKFIFGRRYQGESGFNNFQALKASGAGTEGSNIFEAQSCISDGQMETDLPDSSYQQIVRMHQPVKIIHKEHDAITSFCINKVCSLILRTVAFFAIYDRFLIAGSHFSHSPSYYNLGFDRTYVLNNAKRVTRVKHFSSFEPNFVG